MAHEKFIQRCIQLAKLGAGQVAPNPMVGAVLVYKDAIIGEGYHQVYGGPHAEVNCINSVLPEHRALISQSTLYVSLEPCAHYGKTPPCADLIIAHHIPEVIIGCRDSFAEVDGKGIEKLKAAGIMVTIAVLHEESRALNKRFFCFHEKKRPYIILKWAQTADGFIANADRSRLLISNDSTNRLVHQWRSEEASIMVGTYTAMYDNPSLTVRLVPGNNPVRIVVDNDLKLPASLHLFDQQVKTIVFNTIREENNGNVHYVKTTGRHDLHAILDTLHQMKIQSVLVEGGSGLLQSFISNNYWDEARVITNQNLQTGQGIAAPVLQDEVLLKKEEILTDTIQYFKNADAAY